MRLHEYQSKSIFSQHGIPIPKGRVANTAGEVKQIAEELGGRVVIKAQVLDRRPRESRRNSPCKIRGGS